MTHEMGKEEQAKMASNTTTAEDGASSAVVTLKIEEGRLLVQYARGPDDLVVVTVRQI